MDIIGFFMGACITSFLLTMHGRYQYQLTGPIQSFRQLLMKGSSCGACHQPIAWHQMIPVVSWLLLNGKCSQCHRDIGRNILMTEFVGGALGLVVHHYTLDIFLTTLLTTMIMISLLMCSFDLHHYCLPIFFLILLTFAHLIALFKWSWFPIEAHLTNGLLNLFLFLLPCGIAFLFSRTAVLGVADIIILYHLLCWLGPSDVPLFMLSIGVFVGIHGFIYKQRVIPLVPYLFLSFLVCLGWAHGWQSIKPSINMAFDIPSIRF